MKAPRGICPACGRSYSLAWHYSTGPNDQPGWILRRHSVAREPGTTTRVLFRPICDGTHYDPERIETES